MRRPNLKRPLRLIPTTRRKLTWSCCQPSCAQENAADPVAHVKFFTPDSSWTWYATEGEAREDDFLFFGYVCGFEEEWGYFVLSELSEVRGPLGLPIERDLYFQPGPFSEVIQRYRAERGQT